MQQRYHQLSHPEEAFTRQPDMDPSGHHGSIGEALVGSTLGVGAGCSVRIGKKDKRSQSDRIRQDGVASIDVGPLKCGVSIPKGSLTPDVGIPGSP